MEEVADPNAGSPIGVGEVEECSEKGQIMNASDAYPLNAVELKTNSTVKRILFKDEDRNKIAHGVELTNGKTYFAIREVIVSAGAYRTPQLLMLSGIGPTSELSKHGIKPILNSPEVGKNLHSHLQVKQFWKLRNPELGASIGSSQWDTENNTKGSPIDFLVTQQVNLNRLRVALSADEKDVEKSHPLLQLRGHVESSIEYTAYNEVNPKILTDGTHVTSHVIGMLPTSRGSVTISSSDPSAAPVINPNYYATEADKFVMREGLRKFAYVMKETPSGKEMVESETVSDGRVPMTAFSTDEEIDKRVREEAM